MKLVTKNKGITIFLIIILGIVGYLAYLNFRDYKILKEAFELEKEALESDLNHLISDYNKLINMDLDLKKDFETKRKRVYQLKDSLAQITDNDFKFISRVKLEADKLEEENSFIFLAVEYLNKTNNALLYGSYNH